MRKCAAQHTQFSRRPVAFASESCQSACVSASASATKRSASLSARAAETVERRAASRRNWQTNHALPSTHSILLASSRVCACSHRVYQSAVAFSSQKTCTSAASTAFANSLFFAVCCCCAFSNVFVFGVAPFASFAVRTLTACWILHAFLCAYHSVHIRVLWLCIACNATCVFRRFFRLVRVCWCFWRKTGSPISDWWKRKFATSPRTFAQQLYVYLVDLLYYK